MEMTAQISLYLNFLTFFFGLAEIDTFRSVAEIINKSPKWRIGRQLSHFILDFAMKTSKKWNKSVQK